MSEKDIIVHIIHRDKFTEGYINFMKICMSEWEHHFFTRNRGFPVMSVDDKNMHYFHDYDEILNESNIILLRECRKIIISGAWCSKLIRHMPIEFIRKSYPHFWGGDFYNFRFSMMPRSNPIAMLKWFVKRFYQHRLIRNCAGTINLIDGDIEQLCKLFPNNTKHFTAPMKGNPLRKINFAEIRKTHSKIHDTHTIIVGNSASSTNQHVEIFHALGHLKNENINIICPLSYGSDDYRIEIIEAGKNIFGRKFTPVTDFMSFEDYVNLLASCDVGIFNNDRQQAMGNISLLLRLGKKVYMREGTSMWKQYKETIKYTVYPVSELENITLEELVNFPPELAYNNIQIAEERAASNYAVEQWRKVFED